MTDVFSRISIRKFITLMIVFFVVFFSGIATVITYNYTLTTFRNSYTDGYIKSIFLEIEQSLDLVKTQLNNISLNLLNSSQIRQIVNNDALTYELKKEKLSDIFNNVISDKSFITAIDFVSSEGIVFRYGDEKIDTVAYDIDFMEQLSNMQLYIKNNCVECNDNFYLPIGKRIYNYSTRMDVGFIIFYIDESVLGSSYAEFYTSKNIFFVSVDDAIVSHPEKKYINSSVYMPIEMFEEKPQKNYNSGYAIYENNMIEPSVINQIRITGIIANSFLFGAMNRITTIIFMIFIVILLFSIVVALTFSKSFINHVTVLNSNMSKFTYDNTVLPAVYHNEIIQLEESFYKMTVRINELISEIEIEKEKQKITEINFLQAQINPHFIYNALDAVSWKAKINKQPEIDHMILNIATFLRVGLHKGDNIISISDELKHVSSYVKIEKTRFNDLFDVEFEFEESILEKKTIKVILQPIVENCIIHGFKNIDYKGKIIIRAYEEGEEIIFEIEDNGCGIKLEGNKSLPESKNESSGYGLYNVNKRIQMYYGDDCGLFFKSVPYKYTIVKIKIKNQVVGDKEGERA